MKKGDNIYIHSSEAHNPASAIEIVPILLNLFQVQTVVDVGCGLGGWLHVFQNHGVSEILGLNGHWVEKEKLFIDQANFQEINLIHPKNIDRKFDLVLCLEVAEHLPEMTAQTLVQFLSSLGDTIIFSAAIPQQGGQNHINEKEPSYWAGLFSEHGYYFYDIIRDKIWDNSNVKWWYRQNIFVVSKRKLAFPISSKTLVHPESFKEKTRELNKITQGKAGMKKALEILLRSFITFIKRN